MFSMVDWLHKIDGEKYIHSIKIASINIINTVIRFHRYPILIHSRPALHCRNPACSSENPPNTLYTLYTLYLFLYFLYTRILLSILLYSCLFYPIKYSLVCQEQSHATLRTWLRTFQPTLHYRTHHS